MRTRRVATAIVWSLISASFIFASGCSISPLGSASDAALKPGDQPDGRAEGDASADADADADADANADAPPTTAVIDGRVALPETGAPADPGDKSVRSPHPSPVADAAKLTGPKITVKCNTDLASVFTRRLAAGTVVTIDRGCVFSEGRIVIDGAGTDSQPVLVQAAAGAGAAPVFKSNTPGRFKDDAVISTTGTNVHIKGLKIADSASVGFGLEASKSVLSDVETGNVVIGVWIRSGDRDGRGDGSRVWNSYFHDGRMMPDTPGPLDDYGATGIVVEANDVTLEGITGRKLKASSPDYDQYGGDGSLVDVWRKGDNLSLRYWYVDVTPRVLEAGGLGPSSSAKNMTVANGYAKLTVPVDEAFYFNDSGPFAGVDTSGFKKFDLSIVRVP